MAEVRVQLVTCEKPAFQCDPTKTPAFKYNLDWTRRGKGGTRANGVDGGASSITVSDVATGVTAKTSVEATPPPMTLSMSPSGPVLPGGDDISTAGATGPRCCSPSGSGTLTISVRYCGYFSLPGLCYTFNTLTNYSWGGGIAGVNWGYVWCCPEVSQWLSGMSGAASLTYQDGGPQFGLPKGYYGYLNRGPYAGYYALKAHWVRVCVINIGCSGSHRVAPPTALHRRP